MPPLYANATSTAALFPGSLAGAFAYRKECTAFKGAPLKAMIWTSLAGGLAGALLLYATPARFFDQMIPWLLALGTLTFAFGPRASRLLPLAGTGSPTAILAVQALLSVYGGYFGGAAGIMMMGAWSVFGLVDVRAMNAAKTLLVGLANCAAVACFAATGLVWWEQCGIMLAGAVLGGYGGARCARRIKPQHLRIGISLFNVAMTTAFFLRSRH